jgi:hypothetical protein
MTQALLLQLAKQGNPNSIAALMNAALWAESIRVKARVEEDCLHVMLRSPQLLNQHAAIAFIRRGIVRLQPEAIHSVMAYAWKQGDDFPHWIAQFALDEPLPPTPEKTTTSPKTTRRKIQLPELKELARQGDRFAIALLLNQIIKPLEIAAKVAVKEQCLHILLEADSVPDETLSLNLVTTELQQLQLSEIKSAKVYGRQIGQKLPAWTHTITSSISTPVTTKVINLPPTEQLSKPESEEIKLPSTEQLLQPETDESEVAIVPPVSPPATQVIEPSVSQSKQAVSFDRAKRRFSLMEVSFAVAVGVLIYFMSISP